MSKKKTARMNKLELARYLEQMASQIRNGEVQIEDRRWSVPEYIDVKIRNREKKGNLRGKISWKWSVVEDYLPEDQLKMKDLENKLKSVKKRLGKSFARISRVIEDHRYPDDILLAEFEQDSRQFAQMIDPEWRQEMLEYMDHYENFIRAIKDRRMATLQHEIRDLKARMKACHKEFK